MNDFLSNLAFVKELKVIAMNNKPYELGIIVGRFQTFHLGHQDMIDKAAELCSTVGVFIGSSQEAGTEKNPFSYELRKSLLESVYGDRINIFPLPDIGVGNTSKWGDYVLDNVMRRFGRQADIFISGKEERRLDWLGSAAGLGIAEMYIPKSIKISASELREHFIKGDAEAWRQFTDKRLWHRFDELRGIVLNSYKNKDTASI